MYKICLRRLKQVFEEGNNMFEKFLEFVGKSGDFTPRQLKRFLFNLIVISIVATIILFLVLFLAIKMLGLTVKDGKWSIGQKVEQKTPVIVSSTTGWQDSGIEIKEVGAKLSFRASGRICMAVSHLDTLTSIIKPYVANQLNSEEKKIWGDQKVFERYPTPPDFTGDKNIFYRNWIGPEGEVHESDLFPNCKLDNRFKAGELLGVILPNNFSDQDDPLKVLNLNPNVEVFSVMQHNNDENLYTTKTTGKLAFVVNEVVLSPFSQEERAKKSYEILRRLDSTDERHKLKTNLIPLVYFSDNIGSFRVIVKEL